MWLTLTLPTPGCNLFLTQPPVFSTAPSSNSSRSSPTSSPYSPLPGRVHCRDVQGKGLGGQGPTYFSRAAIRNADGIIVIGRCMYDRIREMFYASISTPIGSPGNCLPNTAKRTLPQATRMGWEIWYPIRGEHGAGALFRRLDGGSLPLAGQGRCGVCFHRKGKRRGEIEAYKEKHNLSNIEVLPFPPHSQLAQTMGAGDVHFVSLREAFTGLVVPSKAYCIMAAQPIPY